MKNTLLDEALNQIFREARTHNAWLNKPVSDKVLGELYDLLKWGPTSANGLPARFVFLRTPEAKEVMLKVRTAKFGNVTAVSVEGRIVRGETDTLRNAVLAHVDTSVVILDLAHVNTIDAGGLGVQSAF